MQLTLDRAQEIVEHYNNSNNKYTGIFKSINVLPYSAEEIKHSVKYLLLFYSELYKQNGILKEEYLDHYEIDNLKDAKELLASVVSLYNNERPHMSIGNITPSKVHSGEIQKGNQKWKNYYSKTTQKIEDNI